MEENGSFRGFFIFRIGTLRERKIVCPNFEIFPPPRGIGIGVKKGNGAERHEGIYRRTRARNRGLYRGKPGDRPAGGAGIPREQVDRAQGVTQRLYEIDPLFAAEVRAVLAYNREERHIRGGEATRQKYAHRRGAGMKLV